MKQQLQESFAAVDTLSFSAMTQSQSRRAAASCLFELLVLKSKGFVDIKQKKAFGDIAITATDAL